MSFVGVLHPSMISVEALKRHLIYFDEFHVPGLKLYMLSLSQEDSEENNCKLNSLEHLERTKAIHAIDISVDEIDGLISEANILNRDQLHEHDSYSLAKFNSPYAGIGNIYRNEIDASGLIFRAWPEKSYTDAVTPISHPILTAKGFEFIESDVLSRAYSIRMNEMGVNTIPIIKRINYRDDKKIDNETVISIVIKRFPVMGDGVSFDEVLSFKNEKKDLRLLLRNWIGGISKGDYSAKEIEGLIELLLSEYNFEMKKHKFDLVFGTFETIVRVPVEIAESLIKLKPSAALKSLFSIKHQRAKLLQQEKNAVGREIAYVHHAISRFSR